jgi:hypothetical protein
VKNRVVGLKKVKASDIQPHPLNAKLHPQDQRNVMQGLLEELGMADALTVRELPDGKYELLDGHMRQSMLGDQEVSVLVVDLNDEEAAAFLMTFDMTKLMAKRDDERVNALLDRVTAEDGAVRQMLESMASGEVKDSGSVGLKGGGSTRLRPQLFRAGKVQAPLSTEEAAKLTLLARRYAEQTGSYIGLVSHILAKVKASRAAS